MGSDKMAQEAMALLCRSKGSSLIPGSHELSLPPSPIVQGKNQLLEADLRLAHMFVRAHAQTNYFLSFLDSQSQNNSPIPFQRETEGAGLGTLLL